jgi:agmatinase
MAEYLINHKDPRTADVVLLAAPYDKTSSYGKGADQGPRALRHSFNTQLEIYERFTRTRPADTIKIAFDNSLKIASLRPELMIKQVAPKFLTYYKAGKFVILVGGEHSVSLGPFQALSAYAENTTIVQIDAHADLRASDADYNDINPTKYAHACVMRRAIEDHGFKTVQVGIRAYSHYELAYMQKHKLTVFEWGIKKHSIQSIIKSIKTRNIYLTIDIDGIDPAFMPATGTPVQGGLDWYYTIELICELFKKKNVLAADVVELAPRKDDHGTEYGVAQLCYLMMGSLTKKKHQAPNTKF